MVVKTRSQYSRQQQQQQQESTDSSISATSSTRGGGRRVRITTPSLHEASIRTYKVYTPPSSSVNSRKRHKKHAVAVEELSHNADHEDVDALLSLQDAVPPSPASRRNEYLNHACMNPMHSVTKYLYRISVYNINRSVHMKTAYVLYDSKSRLYHVYTIVSNRIGHHDASAEQSTAELPEPMNTLQLKYTTYISETVVNYVMTLIVPSNHYDYYIQDDILGIVSNHENVFDDDTDTSFYDIEGLLYDKSSTLTTNGYKAFMLLPSRQFWYYGDFARPAAATAAAAAEAYEVADDQIYTYNTIQLALIILGNSY
jgi:hypothetical protein